MYQVSGTVPDIYTWLNTHNNLYLASDLCLESDNAWIQIQDISLPFIVWFKSSLIQGF